MRRARRSIARKRNVIDIRKTRPLLRVPPFMVKVTLKVAPYGTQIVINKVITNDTDVDLRKVDSRMGSSMFKKYKTAIKGYLLGHVFDDMPIKDGQTYIINHSNSFCFAYTHEFDRLITAVYDKSI